MNNNYEQNGQNVVPQPVMPQPSVTPVVEPVVSQPQVEPVQQPTINQNYGYSNMAPVQNNKKKLPVKEIAIIAVALVVIVALGYFVYSKFFKGGDDAYLEILDQNKLIPIEENDLYGYIDTKGKVVITPQYSTAGTFYDGYAAVTKENEETNKGVVYIINEKGEVKAQTQEHSYISSYLVEYVIEDKVWIVEGKLYDSKLKLVTAETVTVEYDDGIYTFYDAATNKYGIMNSKGKETYSYPATGDEIVSISASEVSENLENQYCVIKVSSYDNNTDKYGIINCDTGKFVVALGNKYIDESDDNIFTVYDGDDYWSNEETELYIQGDKILYQADAKDGDLYFDYESDGYLEIYDRTKSYSEGRYSYYIIATGTVTDDEPESSNSNLTEWEEETGITEFECSNGYGLMSDEKVSLTCEWDDIETLSVDVYNYTKAKAKKQVVLLERDSNVIVYDLKKNESLFTFNSSYVTDYSTSTFLKAKDSDTNEIVIYNLATNKYQNFDSEAEVKVYSNYITVELDNKINYYNTKLENIYTVNVEK